MLLGLRISQVDINGLKTEFPLNKKGARTSQETCYVSATKTNPVNRNPCLL